MAKPFANSQQYNGDLIDSYIMELQIGSTTDDGGLAQMRSIQLGKLKSYLKEGMGATFNYRGKYGTLPTDLAVGDSFVASLTFTVGGQTYEEGHLYAWNGTSWDDITDIFTQYAQQAEVDSINERLTEAEEKIDALSGFIFKGDATRATLPTASASNQGWVYYLTDESIYVASDGTQWVTVMSFVGQTIAEGDTTHAPSSDAVYKALAERDAKDADLQSQIVNTNAELDNVEAFIGGDAQVENTDPTEGESLLAQSRLIHHANLLPNGDFGRVGARSVAWKQLVEDSNFSDVSKWGTTNGSFSVANNIGTLTLNGATGAVYQRERFALQSGHVYLCAVDIQASNSTMQVRISNAYGGSDVFAQKNTNWQTLKTKWTCATTGQHLYPQIYANDASANDTVQVRNFVIFDLTVMGLDSLTADQFRAKFPASYYPNDTGHIYDLNPTGFRIRGINLWDEEWEYGFLNATTGQPEDSSSRVRSKNYIPVESQKTYYGYFGSISTANWALMFCYDANKNFLGYVSAGLANVSCTTLVGTAFIKFYYVSSSPYANDIQICDNSISTSIKTTYHPYEEHTVETPQISDGHYINDSVYDYVENVTEDGVLKGKKHTVVGSYTFTGNETWVRETAGAIYIFRSALTGKKVGLDNLLMSGYVTTDVASSSAMPDKSVRGHATSPTMLLFRDDSFNDATSFAQSLAGRTIYFGIANETITDCEPLRSFPISDYCTVEPITPQTELVNRIDVPFSVKSVSANTLIEQITQNTADIAEEKAIRSAQVSALDKRVTNLELKTGDQFEVDYPSDTYGMDGVPSNVEPYAEVKVLKGVGRGTNNLANPVVRESETYGVTYKTYADGKVTLVGTATTSFNFVICTVDIISGHTYLLSNYGAKMPISATNLPNVQVYAPNVITTVEIRENATTNYALGQSVGTGQADLRLRIENGNTYNLEMYPFLTDMNIYFNGNIPTGLDIAMIQQKYPELLIPSDYGTSAVFPTYTAMKSKGVNLWDEEWETGYIDWTGNNAPQSNRIRSKNYIPVLPSTLLYYKAPKNLQIFYYDIEKNLISYESSSMSNVSRTTPSNCYYIRFYTYDTSYGGTYLHDIQICLDSYADKTTYHPYMTDTLTLPTPVTPKGVGAVSEEYFPKTGRVTHPLRSYTFTGNETGFSSATVGRVYLYVAEISPIIKIPSSRRDKANILCVGWIPIDDNHLESNSMQISVGTSGQIGFCLTKTTEAGSVDALKAYLQNHETTIYFGLATPDPDTYVDPLPDNHIKVEPNGTVKAVQSQSPEVDSAMTVEYMAS